jgi:PIN domain nuclease of toxin-antitoxin system
MRYLLDTHVLLRWRTEPARLTKDQNRALAEAMNSFETVAISGVTLVEMALLSQSGRVRLHRSLGELLADIKNEPMIEVLPITPEIAIEVAALVPILRDPSDSVIAATARAHGLRLLTSDTRIIESNCVSTID